MIVFAWLLGTTISAQDTLSVFFDSGKWRIPRDQALALNELPYRIDLTSIDSIHFIGMADSIGLVESNLKLSDRRVREVAQRCEELLPARLRTRAFAIGAISMGDRARNRRVDIVFHSRASSEHLSSDTPKESDTGIEEAPPCYVIDCELIGRYTVREFMKGRRTFVEVTVPGLLTPPNPSRTVMDLSRPRYHGVRSGKDPFEPRQIKWTRKPARNRKSPPDHIASMPSDAFEQWGIRVQVEADDCVQKKLDTCIRVDHALMQNLQFKQRLFRSSTLLVRAPRSAVDLSVPYFMGCKKEIAVNWTERGGKRRSGFYYTELFTLPSGAMPISRSMISCETGCDTTGCNKGYFMWRCLRAPDEAWKITLESGYRVRSEDNNVYAAMGLCKAGSQGAVTVLIGMDGGMRPFALLRYQVHFLDLSLPSLRMLDPWQWPTDQVFIDKYIRAYAGAEFMARPGSGADRLLEPSAHIGVAFVNERPKAMLPRVFAHAGIGTDGLAPDGSSAYMIASAGCVIRLVRFGP